MSTPAADEDLPDLCTYCNTKAPIYTCPRCFTQTCSLSCCKRHKVYKQCSGVRDPTAFVKRSRLMTPAGINRDYNFLTLLERKAARPREKEEAGRDDAECMSKRFRRENVQRMAAESGVSIKWAPWDGFYRATINRTCSRRGKLRWTIEWLLDGRHSEVSHNSAESLPLWEAWQNSNVRAGGEERVASEQTAYFLTLQAPGNLKRCVRLAKEKTLKENLRERTVLEFPSIVVTNSEEPPGWEVAPDERKIIEVGTEVQSTVSSKKRVMLEDDRAGDKKILAGSKDVASGGFLDSLVGTAKRPRIAAIL